MAKKWYVIQTYSGYENKVKEALLQRIKEHNKEAAFGEILIPTETVQEAATASSAFARRPVSPATSSWRWR
jgi:transcription termination/antitermination protein NusG